MEMVYSSVLFVKLVTVCTSSMRDENTTLQILQPYRAGRSTAMMYKSLTTVLGGVFEDPGLDVYVRCVVLSVRSISQHALRSLLHTAVNTYISVTRPT